MTAKEIIDEICEEKGISKREIARRIGMTAQQFSYKVLHNSLRIDELYQVAEACGASIVIGEE